MCTTVGLVGGVHDMKALDFMRHDYTHIACVDLSYYRDWKGMLPLKQCCLTRDRNEQLAALFTA